MDNYTIAENFSLLSKLMDIHGDDSFRAKSYSIAAFSIEKLETSLADMKPSEIFSIKGIGDRMGKRVLELLETGRLSALEEYLEKTPPGVLQMLSIKGLGPKKISTIWKEMEIFNIGELLYACTENRLTRFKGFGQKTQDKVRESIEFYLGTLGSYLYAQIEPYALEMDSRLQKALPEFRFALTGEFRRQMEVITRLEWVTTIHVPELEKFFGDQYQVEENTAGYILFRGPENLGLGFHLVQESAFCRKLFETSCAGEFLECWKDRFSNYETQSYGCEDDIFSAQGLAPIPVFYREIKSAIGQKFNDDIVQLKDIRGIIHTHSRWSDGSDTIEDMALAARELGMEYLVISDHSRTAAYAQGLTDDRVKMQHIEIDRVNAAMAPFRVFKSIESDILGDGSLDYENELLATFDLVIASVHSNLYMNEEKAMTRLLCAIENPFTSILGHMTGRLLLSRNGYPLDHRKIIDACAANDVVIELNANPRRLDMDWRHIGYALEKGVLISIDPDAHDIAAFNDIRYGVLSARKGGLPKASNLSSFGLAAFESWITRQHAKR